MYALRSSKRDEREIKAIFSRVDSARAVLDVSIEVAQSAAMGSMCQDLAVTLSAVQRIDTKVHTMPVDAEYTDDETRRRGGRSKSRAGSTSPSPAPSKNVPTHSTTYESLSADQDAMQFNGDVGSTVWQQPLMAEYRTTQARGKSVQVNGRIDLQSFQAIISTRR